MAEFNFHSAAEDSTTKLLRLGFYLGALLLLAAGIYELYLYFTAWTGPESSVWPLILGIIYLLVSALVAYAAYRQGGADEEQAERYAEVKNGKLIYVLDQVSGRQEIVLGDVQSVSRPSVRDLIVTMRDGSQRVVPIYLIDDETKQAQLERMLTTG